MDYIRNQIGDDAAFIVFGYLPLSEKLLMDQDFMARYEQQYGTHEHTVHGNSIYPSQTKYTLDGIPHRCNGPAVIYYYSNGVISRSEWFRNGQSKRLDGPSITKYDRSGIVIHHIWIPQPHDGPSSIYYYESGSIKLTEWRDMDRYGRGVLHRDGGAACICYYPDGQIKEKSWYCRNKIHRLNSPAYLSYYLNGQLRSVQWHQNDSMHRSDGPAALEFYPDGQIKSEKWDLNDLRHRDDGPARTDYYESGVIRLQCWFQNNVLYRRDGPARIEYDSQGNVENKKYHVSEYGMSLGARRE